MIRGSRTRPLLNILMHRMSLRNRTLFITGGSRGIGLAIALRAARDGANVAIAAKTTERHPKLPGTIYDAAAEIERAGGRALPLAMDVRDELKVQAAIAKTVDHFGGIDICVNNASALNVSQSLLIDMKRFDLIQQINTRGTFVVSRCCVPHLRRSDNPHILTLSPPLTLRADWFAAHLAYAISKYGMSMCMLGMAEEFKGDGIACNTLWPRTTIATAAVEFTLGGDAMMRRSRTPAIMADAAYIILTKSAEAFTGQFCIDDEVLAGAGVTDLEKYRVNPTEPLQADIFIDPSTLTAP
jgi:citronellol/citronellal dehydrogenase